LNVEDRLIITGVATSRPNRKKTLKFEASFLVPDAILESCSMTNGVKVFHLYVARPLLGKVANAFLYIP